MSFDATLYCALHTGTPGDREFYGHLAAGKSVLELGGGDGRISEAMLKSGAHVSSVEHHPGMVSLAMKRKASLDPDVQRFWTIETGNMANFSLDQRFDLVVIPYSGIFCLAPPERRLCFQRIAEHLKPDGLLVYDTYATEGIFDEITAVEEEWSPLTILQTEDGLVLVNEREMYGPGQQVKIDYRFELIAEDENIPLTTDTLLHECFGAEQAQDELEKSGFVNVSVFGDFERSDYGPDAEIMVVMATWTGRT